MHGCLVFICDMYITLCNQHILDYSALGELLLLYFYYVPKHLKIKPNDHTMFYVKLHSAY